MAPAPHVHDRHPDVTGGPRDDVISSSVDVTRLSSADVTRWSSADVTSSSVADATRWSSADVTRWSSADVTSSSSADVTSSSSADATRWSSADVTRLSSAVPARDRTVVVDEPFGSMLPDRGLPRGRVIGCDGPAAVSLACGLVAGPVRAGSWLLLLGVPMIGVDALAELGVPVHRVVAVDAQGSPSGWAERLAAAADGFELIMAHPPRGADRVERQVRQRLQARGTVLVSVGVSGHAMGCDLAFTTTSPRWSGIGQGHGRLVAREVEVRLGGRRMPRPVEQTVLLPGPSGRVETPAGAAAPAVREDVLERVG